jgi:hypothetical protein
MAENEVTLRVEAGKARPKHEPSDDDEPADLSAAPLFANLETNGTDKVDHVVIDRIGPVREGNLGRFETDVNEEQIFARCGGGKYRLQCRTEKGKPIKGAFLTVEIAGEPIFQSELAQRMYERQVGGMRRPADATPAAATGMSPQELLALLEQTRSSADAERERRAEQEEARHNRELARIKAESEARAAERAAEDERRRTLEIEREDRRRREEEDRRRRDKQDEIEREERNRQFQLQIAAFTKASTPAAPAVDPIATLLAGVKLASSLGGGGGGDGAPADPITALASNLPQTVQELGKMFRGEGGAGGGAAADPNNLIITGELGQKGNRVIVHLRQQGLQPEALLSQAFDLLLTMRGTGTAPAAAAPPPPARRGPGGRPITTTATTVHPAQPAQPTAQAAPAPAQPAQPVTGTQPSVYPKVTPPAPAPDPA